MTVNKAHSVGYGYLTYRTAWLKAHYPVEFMCAVITKELDKNGKDKDTKVASAVADARSLGIAILPPDINRSNLGCSVENGAVCLGLNVIKGLGPRAIEGIIESRPYTSLQDLYERVNRQKVNKARMICAIAGGAMDTFNRDRLSLLNEYAQLRNEDSFTEVYASKDNRFFLPSKFTEMDKLEWEKSLIGFYISGHPLEELKLEPWTEIPQGKEITVAGTVTDIRKTKIGKGRNIGREMAFITLDTQEGNIRATIFADEWQENANKVEKGKILKIVGRKDGDASMIANKITRPRLKGLKELVV